MCGSFCAIIAKQVRTASVSLGHDERGMKEARARHILSVGDPAATALARRDLQEIVSLPTRTNSTRDLTQSRAVGYKILCPGICSSGFHCPPWFYETPSYLEARCPGGVHNCLHKTCSLILTAMFEALDLRLHFLAPHLGGLVVDRGLQPQDIALPGFGR